MHFSWGAFGNPLALKNIQDDDIDHIEQSIREKRFMELQNTQNVENQIGMDLAANLSKFEFRRGDRVLIKELAAHVKSKINEKGIQYFNSKIGGQINKISCYDSHEALL